MNVLNTIQIWNTVFPILYVYGNDSSIMITKKISCPSVSLMSPGFTVTEPNFSHPEKHEVSAASLEFRQPNHSLCLQAWSHTGGSIKDDGTSGTPVIMCPLRHRHILHQSHLEDFKGALLPFKRRLLFSPPKPAFGSQSELREREGKRPEEVGWAGLFSRKLGLEV